MHLPKLPYTMRKTERQITEFLGLNLSENTKEGELFDAYGLTTANYPCITQREGRSAVEGYNEPTDIFEWDGKLLVVDSGLLYYDGKPIDNVSPGKKQFAVLNSQIVVLPDKLCISTIDGTYRRLGASVTTVESAQITTNSITAYPNPVIKTGCTTKRFIEYVSTSGYDGNTTVVYTYGKNLDAIKNCWDKENQAWSGLSDLQTLKTVHHTNGFTPNYESVEIGDIIIPKKIDNSFSWVDGSKIKQPDTTLYNTEGYYAVVTELHDGTVDHIGVDYFKIQTAWKFDVYNAGVENALLSIYFSVGDYVDISGTANGANDVTHKKITAIDGSANTLYFADDTFSASSTESAVTIQVPFPELDFICEKGNRLWGVSNKDNAIYVSSRGLPNDFYSYDGLPDDAYAVVVGSEGDFTAICAYGDSVLCWKENILHKVLGDFPSEYYMNDYKIAGVQSGSDRSLAIINETLYYKGVFGVYAYTGGTPSLISYNLGNRICTDGVGGGYNNRYYLNMLSDGGDPLLAVYDITHGLWMKEDNIRVDAFARLGSTQYMLSGSTVYEIGEKEGESFNWMAEFVPFTETAHAKKGYTKLLLRLDMENKSYMKVEIKEDRGLWRVAHTQSATKAMTLHIPLRIGRCDRFSVRLSGKGRVTIRSMVRELYAGSEV